MRTSAKVLFMLLTLALALPAAVHAQSAGDDQYVDPFEGQEGGGGGGNNGGGNGGNDGAQTGGSDDGSSTTTAQTPPGDTAGTTSQGTTDESSGATLPRTGLQLLPIVLAGAFLLAAGLALRRGARVPGAMPSLATAGHAPPAAAPRLPVASPTLAPIRERPASPASAPRAGAIGLGIVGLFILSTVLRRRA